jgi:hypothetical protein
VAGVAETKRGSVARKREAFWRSLRVGYVLSEIGRIEYLQAVISEPM